ncbi:MAG: outer membrane beta-barrel protein [Planctomycetota bacterium]
MHDYDGMTVAPPTNLLGTFSDGWGFGLACGRRLRNCYRAELEFSYRRNTGENWVINGVPGRWSGDFNSYAGMANLYRDIPALDLYGCTPYVGGGIGFASLRSSLNTAATTILIDDFAFAFQFMAGSTKTIGERVDLFTEYRYFAPTDVGVTNIGVFPVVVLDDDRFDNHGLFFGLRYHYRSIASLNSCSSHNR